MTRLRPGSGIGADIITFPGTTPRDGGKPRATLLAERLAANLGGEHPADCADALTRLLASICCVNAINVTEAVEAAQLMARDLEELTRGMMAEGT